MEIAPDLQFKHYTVAEAKLPAEVLVARGRSDARRDVAICCDLEHHVFYAAHTDPAGRRRPARVALVRAREWAQRRPRRGPARLRRAALPARAARAVAAEPRAARERRPGARGSKNGAGSGKAAAAATTKIV